MGFRAVNKAAPLPAAKPSDEMARAFVDAVLLAGRRGRELWPIEYLERAIAHRNPMTLIADGRWRTIDQDLRQALEEAIGGEVAAAGGAELARLDRTLPPVVGVPQYGVPIFKANVAGRFDLRNPFSEDFVRRRSGELVTSITEQTRAFIRDAVEAGFVDGVPVRTTARVIQAGIGLDPRLQRALANHGRELSAQGADDETIERSLSRYADQLLRYRAELIARTETVTASNQGTLDSWRQASREGLLPGGMKKRWIHGAGSARTCPVCTELGNSDPVPMGGTFFSTILMESFEAPPAHPNCRCTVGLVRP